MAKPPRQVDLGSTPCNSAPIAVMAQPEVYMQHIQGTLLEYLVLVIREIVPLGLTGHLLHKSTLSILTGIKDLLNT